MTALTALDWRYRPWIFNRIMGRWECMNDVMPREGHSVGASRSLVYVEAEAIALRDKLHLRTMEFSEVPEPE